LQIFDPSSHSAPATFANVSVNGTIGSCLPDSSAWRSTYDNDDECCLIRKLIANPSLAVNEHLNKIHHTLRLPLRQNLLMMENDMIIFHKPLGGGSNSYCKLHLAPSSLRNAIFIAFHANPIGGHVNYYHTFKNICLRFYWPGMLGYIKHLCSKCPACALSNCHRSRAKELIYGFPITASFLVLRADGYSAALARTLTVSPPHLISH
jgi:hypothetical protein